MNFSDSVISQFVYDSSHRVEKCISKFNKTSHFDNIFLDKTYLYPDKTISNYLTSKMDP